MYGKTSISYTRDFLKKIRLHVSDRDFQSDNNFLNRDSLTILHHLPSYKSGFNVNQYVTSARFRHVLTVFVQARDEVREGHDERPQGHEQAGWGHHPGLVFPGAEVRDDDAQYSRRDIVGARDGAHPGARQLKAPLHRRRVDVIDTVDHKTLKWRSDFMKKKYRYCSNLIKSVFKKKINCVDVIDTVDKAWRKVIAYKLYILVTCRTWPISKL